jgi:hypothetical protein
MFSISGTSTTLVENHYFVQASKDQDRPRCFSKHARAYYRRDGLARLLDLIPDAPK